MRDLGFISSNPDPNHHLVVRNLLLSGAVKLFHFLIIVEAVEAYVVVLAVVQTDYCLVFLILKGDRYEILIGPV